MSYIIIVFQVVYPNTIKIVLQHYKKKKTFCIHKDRVNYIKKIYHLIKNRI